LDTRVIEKLDINTGSANLKDWTAFVEKVVNPTRRIEIALVGKYVEHHDSYKSIVEAFVHAGAVNDAKVTLRWVQSDDLTEANVAEALKGVSGVLVAPGFGGRGIAGKLAAVRHVRENGTPFFGICLGMQCAVIEFARNVCGLDDANSTEFDPESPHPVIDIMAEQKLVTDKGGTMRLGKFACTLEDGTHALAAYGSLEISERHRHRYEFNNAYTERLTGKGLRIAGINPDRGLVEIVENPAHPWFVGVQFHPELKSTVGKPHPLFVGFVKAALTHAASV
jgi:CTP synthase